MRLTNVRENVMALFDAQPIYNTTRPSPGYENVAGRPAEFFCRLY